MSESTIDTSALGEKIVKVLKTIYDPEIRVDIYELGLIYDVMVNEDFDVKILMTLTSPNCPVAETLPVEVEEKIKDLEADLYETIPFKRSQAHVHGDDQAWIDKWEKEVEAELGYRKGYLASIMSTKREIQTLTKTSEGA